MQRTALLAIAAVAVAACSANSPFPTESGYSPATKNAAAQQATRPMSGSCMLQFDPPPFPLPAIHHQTDAGTCNLTHLGNTAIYGEQDINFAAGTQSGWRTLTAANGDELHATHTGTSWLVRPGVVGFTAIMTLSGGTGRFANASGEMTMQGEATLATNTTVVRVVSGSITY
jgi:hypothetical protein